jgi:hypothetical protein
MAKVKRTRKKMQATLENTRKTTSEFLKIVFIEKNRFEEGGASK